MLFQYFLFFFFFFFFFFPFYPFFFFSIFAAPLRVPPGANRLLCPSRYATGSGNSGENGGGDSEELVVVVVIVMVAAVVPLDMIVLLVVGHCRVTVQRLLSNCYQFYETLFVCQSFVVL